MRIIPAIDLLDKKVVRLTEGKFSDVTEYAHQLPDLVKSFESEGTDFVQIIDLNGAQGDFSNQQWLINSLKNTNLKIQYGGGVRSIHKLKELIDAGIHRVIIGTQAITDDKFLDDLASEICGKNKCSDQVILAVDVLDGIVHHTGWTKSSNIKIIDYVDKCISKGFYRFLCTDISRDGKLGGPNINLYKDLKSRYPFIKLIASGGISTIHDIELLETTKVEYCVIGKAYYEEKISLDDIKNWNLRSLVSL